jgi:DNA polymerase-3 subunit beta
MRITATAAVLEAALKQAGMAAIRRAIFAAFGAVRFVADDELTIAGSNDISIAAGVNADIAEAGHCAVAAEKIAALISSFKDTAEVTISATDSMMTIVSGNSRSRLPLVPWDNLPPPLAIEAQTGWTEIHGDELLTLLEPLAAASREETRYYLNGIFLHSVDHELVSVATDGTRLIRTAVAADTFSRSADLILPRENAAILQRLAKSIKPAEKVGLRRSGRLFAVTAPGLEFTTKLIDATYPNYGRIIPAASNNAVTCNRAELLAALSRLEAVASAEVTPLVALAWEKDRLGLLLARQPLDGSDALDAQVAGHGRIAVSIEQFSGLLNEFSGARLRLEAANKRSPLLIRGDGNKLGLLMPCQWNFDSEELQNRSHFVPLGRDAEHQSGLQNRS